MGAASEGVPVIEESLAMAWAGAPRGLSTGYLARPDTTHPSPGLLVLHEVGGLNASIRAAVRRLAANGYVTFAPDLYAGAPRLAGLARLVAGTALWPLRNRPLVELRRGLTAFQARTEVDAARLGVVGYSMGAGYALQLACCERGVKVVAAFCGQLPRPREALGQACPIVASYAGRDLTTTGLAAKLGRALASAGVPHDLKVYPGALHAFYDPYGPMYDPAAAEDAWQRTLAFLRRRLS